MLLRYFYDDKIAHASYLVGCEARGEAMVIDPARDVEPYLQVARENGLKIVAVAETHIHAIIAGISLPNDPSIRFHEKLGFMKVAHFREVGYKLGRWIDVGYWELLNRY